MKFRKTTTCSATMSKQLAYEFEVTKEQIEEAKKRDYNNPLLIPINFGIIGLFYSNGELNLRYYISYYGFVEGKGDHELKTFNNCSLCSCGERFNQKTQEGREKAWEKHLDKLNEAFK